MKRSVVLLPSLWRKWYSIARLLDRKETLYPSYRKAQGSSKDTVTFLGVRFYIDFEESLVDKRFKGFRDCAIIIRRGSWKWAWHWVILCGSPRRLTFGCSLFILYCNVFRRLRLENYLKTTRWAKANHFRTVGLRIVSWILLWITGLKLWVVCFITPSISPGWVMTRTNKTQNAS